MLAVLDLADLYVVVVTPHLGCLRNTRHFLEVARTLGYSEDRMCFVLNRANSLAGLAMDQIAAVLGTRRIQQVPSAGGQVSQLINEGTPMLLNQPRSSFARAIAELADRVRVLAAA